VRGWGLGTRLDAWLMSKQASHDHCIVCYFIISSGKYKCTAKLQIISGYIVTTENCQDIIIAEIT